MIIFSIVVSIFSASKEQKKKIASMGKFRSKTRVPKTAAHVADDASLYEDEGSMAEPVEGECYQSVTSATEAFIADSPEQDKTRPLADIVASVGRQARRNQTQECRKMASEIVEESQESEFSLNDPDAAKRAIIYSEILKPKF